MSHAEVSDKKKTKARRCAAGVSLDVFRRRRGLTWQDLAALIGATSARQARAWALGEERPNAMRIDFIQTATGGEVTVDAMYQVRLAYERRHAVAIEHVQRTKPAHPSSVRRAAAR